MQPSPPPETAHVLFMDIVGYSQKSQEEQQRLITLLTEKVRNTHSYQRACIPDDLILCATGDGMALVFFHYPDAPLRCAIEVAHTLKNDSTLPLRMGLHLGPVTRIVDINGNINVSGDGINMAQRVMDCGGAGHILLSGVIAEGLQKFDEWRDSLNACGEYIVKHGRRTDIFNFAREDIGNAECPAKKSVLPNITLPYPPNPNFVGRIEDLKHLHLLINPDLEHAKPRRIAIKGMGGEGKTQLAVEYAYQHRADYAGGVYWIDARSVETLEHDIAEISRHLHVRSDDSGARLIERVMSKLHGSGSPILLILDNVTERTPLESLTSSDSLHILVTTQREDLPEDFTYYELCRLDMDSALQLLQTHRKAMTEAEIRAAHAIVESVDSLPLALALAAKHIHTLRCSFSRYKHLLAENPSEILKDAREFFHNLTGHSGSVFDTIQLSCTGLTQESLTVLTTAACFSPRDIPVALLRSVCGFSEMDFDRALAQLRVRSLVGEVHNEEKAEDGDEPGSRLSMHELIRVYARLSPHIEVRERALQNTISHLSERLKQANDAMDWRDFRREIRHCQSAARLGSLQTILPTGLDDLLCELGRYFYEQRDLKDAFAHLQEISNFVQQRYGKDSVPNARLLYTLATTCQDIGNSRRALQCAHHALHISRRLRPVNQRLLADCYNDVGYVLRWQTRRDSPSGASEYIHLDKALYLYNRAFDTYALAFDERNEQEVTLKRARQAMCHNNIGVILEHKGDLESAFRRFHTARSFALRAYDGQNVTIGIYLENMGRIRLKQKNYLDAIQHYEQACSIYAAAYNDPEHPDVAACLKSMAEAAIGIEENTRALQLLTKALDIFSRREGDDSKTCENIRARIREITHG